jgi:hypothetical protein
LKSDNFKDLKGLLAQTLIDIQKLENIEKNNQNIY